MSDKIKLKICLPNEVFLEEDVDKLQVPAFEGDITILSRRAPSVFLLKPGFIRILDNDYKEKDKYIIKNGVVDFENGICRIMVEGIADYKKITVKDIEEMRDTTPFRDEGEGLQHIIDIMNAEKLKGK